MSVPSLLCLTVPLFLFMALPLLLDGAEEAVSGGEESNGEEMYVTESDPEETTDYDEDDYISSEDAPVLSVASVVPQVKGKCLCSYHLCVA